MHPFHQPGINNQLKRQEPIRKIDINAAHYYQHDLPSNHDRTRLRLIKIEECGMEEVGICSFGYPGIMGGLYIEYVWNYSDKEFKEYMDWAIELIKNNQ